MPANDPTLPGPSELDLTTEQQLPPPASGRGGAEGNGGGTGSGGAPMLQDYNPEQDREKMRGEIAKLLLCLLIAVVVLSFLLLSYCDKDQWGFLKEFLTIVFGPLTTLIGAVTGFYYGSVTKQKS